MLQISSYYVNEHTESQIYDDFSDHGLSPAQHLWTHIRLIYLIQVRG